MNTIEKLLSPEEASKLTSIPRSWFYTQIREDKIPYYKMGRYVRIPVSAIEKCFKDVK